ncbi:stromal interaction molecule homolog isoform X2 [Argiope bruennichi]|uniref:Stromal interaction molecule like protein n=1 Tax=Argiope bruennichi TaxID=94029 RepID=A0A8T0EVV1_ARGBR|nr:stromal interaction molecule homolog isoform X2 [Argiope bruennichi]KAF8782443.1 Stromal interaction molecule like protein [Argiope bruennichi]
MDFVFIFCIPWILLSSIGCRNFLKHFYLLFCVVLFTCSIISVSSEDSEVSKEEFLIKSSKVIEAVPNVLRRGLSTATALPDDWDCAAVLACDDPVGYEAIRSLHRQLDDDANGSIDVSETDEFLRDELQYENGRHKERHKEFHGDDKYINVDELWQAWRISEVHNWTVDQTVEWLITQVELPQYEHNFRNNGVNGAVLPLLAQNTHNFISHNLGIKDSISKQKIALKAMDVVLFGPPKYRNYYKDVFLALSLLIAVGGCWFAYVQHKRSQTHMVKMMKDMEALQKAEDSLFDLQKELSKARQEQEIVSIEKQDLERRLQDEISIARKYLDHAMCEGGEVGDQARLLELERELQLARNDLREAEKKLEARHWVAPTKLQQWLQLTHELELKNYNAKKAIAEQQLQAAKEGCEKLSKKRATFMGAFRIAHGSSIDDVDDRIVKAKSALFEVTNDLQERMHRWKQIEVLCGVPIILNPGLTFLENILKSGKGNGTVGSTHSGLSTLSLSSSDTTLREESPPPYVGVVQTSVTSTKTTERLSFKGKRFLIHRDSGISLTPAAHSPAIYGPSTSRNGTTSNIPPPTYSKSSPSFTKKISSEGPSLYSAALPPTVSRVVYPKECYRPVENLSSFETDNEDLSIVEDDSTERSVTPPSLASCPETQRPVFTVDGNSGEEPVQKSKDSEPMIQQLTTDQSNGKMSDIVRKISASIMSDKKKKPGSLVIEALKKSASSSNIIENADGGASSESSSSVVSEEKVKKKKFFQTLRHRKPKF